MNKILLFIFLIFTSCTNFSPPPLTELIDLTDIRALVEATRYSANNLSELGYDIKSMESALSAIYAEGNYQPLWYQNGKLSLRGRTLIESLRQIDHDGLSPQDYLPAFLNTPKETAVSDDIGRKDITLSLSILRLYIDGARGRPIARSADGEAEVVWDRRTEDLTTILRTASLNNDPFEGIRSHFPPHDQYALLRTALGTYLDRAATRSYNQVTKGITLKKGTTDSRVQLIKENLAILGDLNARATYDNVFDSELYTAVQRFQRRHGLNPSGSVDGETLDELNVTPAERVKTLIVNLERWRWLPEDRTVSKQVWVNIAGFELVTLSQHQFTLRSPVVVGKRYLSTPLFSSYIKEIKFNPDWTVPTSIVTKELLPKIRKDPTYLAKEHMRILDSNGHELPPSALHTDQRLSGIQIRQDPGPWNALGRIKFVFPNRYGVYLHDTPSRSLFSREQRALSHGCIRVAEAHSLARYLLDEPDDRWTAERINELVEAKKTITVRLRQPVRINVSYRTAWVDADGILNFRPDIYGRDARMKDVLFDGEALLRDRVDISPFS